MSNKFKKLLGVLYGVILIIATALLGSYLILNHLKDFLMTAELSNLQAFVDIYNISGGVFIWIFDIKMFQEIYDNI